MLANYKNLLFNIRDSTACRSVFLNFFEENVLKPRILICQFRPGDSGAYCEQPIGQGPGFGRVFPSRKSAECLKVGVKYLCRVDSSPSQWTHYVTVVNSARDVLKVFLSALCAAEWKRGSHATDDIKTECLVGGEHVTATWYQSVGRFSVKFVTLKFPFEGESVSFTIEESDAREEITAIEKRVRECAGPAIAR